MHGEEILLGSSSPQKSTSQNLGIDDQERGSSVGRAEKSLGSLRCLTCIKIRGEQADQGYWSSWSRGSRLALPDSRRPGRTPEEGGHSLLGSSCGGGGAGRQAGGQGSPAGRGQGRDNTLKGQACFAQASLPVTHLPSTSQGHPTFPNAQLPISSFSHKKQRSPVQSGNIY